MAKIRNPIIVGGGKENYDTAKGLADGSLTEFVASDFGVTSLKNERFRDFTNLTKLDLTGVTNIPSYTAYGCTGITELVLDENTTNIGQYAFYNLSKSISPPIIELKFNNTVIDTRAFQGSRTKTIEGILNNIGERAFELSETLDINARQKIDIKVNGSIGSYAFSGHLTVPVFNLDKTSNITSLGSYAFKGLGQNRQNASTNVFIFDFRNSTFTTVSTYIFSGDSTNKNIYFDIYFPSTLTTIGTNTFRYSDYFNIYYKSIPGLSSTNNFSNATNLKNFFPYNFVYTAKHSTNWSSSTNGIVNSIFGYAEENTFSLGDTLPETDSEGYELTWYSDVGMTTQVTTVSDPTAIYYCSVGAKIKTKLNTNITAYQATVTISDGTNTYNNGDLVPIDATLTITAVGDSGYTDPYIFTLNGTTIVSGDTYTMTNDTINIVCVYDDGINHPFEITFANNTPAQIKTAVDNGFHRILWTIGDTKTITLTNSNQVTVVYRDQQVNRYEKVNGTGYSNAVFEIIPMQKNNVVMNSSSTNSGGWAASRMCTVTMGEIYNLLPSDWQVIISEVKVPSATSGADDTIIYANNKVFIPNGQEIFGSDYVNYYYYDEGCTQFDWYSLHNTDADRIRQYNGAGKDYWLRSPNRHYDTAFIAVSSSGSVANYLASGPSGVLPIFAI